MPSIRHALALGALAFVASGLRPTSAAGTCRIADFDFTPVAGLQIAIWLETADGEFVDTVLVTRGTATLGLGNRPGRMDFDSEYLWPYGRRENALPVWAHRRNVTYPWVTYQDGDENDLSHSGSHSSGDPFYCQPLAFNSSLLSESLDLGSCATAAYTDKGKAAPGKTSLYPPRNDLASRQPGDGVDMMQWAELDELDAVSRATPPGGQRFSVAWALPDDLPDGDYVAWIEVSREQDFNASYNPTNYPSPVGIPWAEYGVPYRGQPSVVWSVPFRSMAGVPAQAQGKDYVGYGDPDGLDGLLSPPDATIDTVAGTYMVTTGKGSPRTVESFGAARLLLETSPAGDYRFRVSVTARDDGTPPASARPQVDVLAATAADLGFYAPADPGSALPVKELEVRHGVGPAPTDLAGFQDGQRLEITPGAPGAAQRFTLSALLPETSYWVGVRAADHCLNRSEIEYVAFTTPALTGPGVDACFVATAAWGSLMGPQVSALRRLRDRVLRRQVLGELFVEAYYTFGPALAEIVRPSRELRALSRAGLSPLVDLAATLSAARDQP